MLSVGIVGLPNVGKSTLFNALTAGGAEVSNYPFTTIDSNVGVVPVPDPRLDSLARVLEPEKSTSATIRFIDIAGLVEGASKGEGLGNKFLGHLRDVDAILHVVRCFEDENIAHSTGAPDPVRDVAIVETELMLADLETAERAVSKAKRAALKGKGEGKEELAVLAQVDEGLEKGVAVRDLGLRDDERRATNGAGHSGFSDNRDRFEIRPKRDDTKQECCQRNRTVKQDLPDVGLFDQANPETHRRPENARHQDQDHALNIADVSLFKPVGKQFGHSR